MVIGILALLLILSSSLALAENDCLYYFYGKGCDSCDLSSNQIKELQVKYPELSVKRIEVYYSKDNLDLLNQYFQAYGIPESQRGLPAVFSATSYFIGEKPIRELLETHINQNDNSVCPTIAENKVLGIVGAKEHITLLQSLTLLTIIKASVSSYLAPGSLALLSILMLIIVILIASGKPKREILRKGLWFIFGSFLIYLLYALGLFTWFGGEEVALWGYKIMGGIAVLLSLLLLRRHLAGKGELFEHMAHNKQQSWKARRDALFSGLGVFILSIIAALFSFAGSSKAFGWMRHLIGLKEGMFLVVIITLFYLLVLFLLPFAVTVLIFLVREVGEDAGERGMWIWKKRQLWWLNSLLALITAAVGVIIILVY